MPFIRSFNDLPDLFFIELFRYLSPIDVLWSFINLNNRIQTLISERGFFHHINLSSACLSTFDTLLTLLPSTQIQTFVIDIEASLLQLSRYSYLPNLTTLRLYGLRDFEDAFTFILRHSHSLLHLTLETNELFLSRGYTGCTWYPKDCLETFMENILPHLGALRSLDLGQDVEVGLPLRHITTIQCPLNYLRLPLLHIQELCHVMSLETLSTTLEQLHVTMGSLRMGNGNDLFNQLLLPKMINLHTFILAQSIFSENRIRWSTIEFLTSPNIMPVLRQVNLVNFITVDDLDYINRSALFTDDRRIDIQFAFIMDYNPLGIQLSQHMPHGSRFHPRQIVRTTCIASCLTPEYRELTNINCYFDAHPFDYDVWYTLPWTFEQVFAVPLQSFQYITKVETCLPLQWNSSIIYPSQLRTLSISQNDSLPSIVSMPHVVQLDRITTVHLLFHDWPTNLNLPNLRHVILTNNLVVLKNFSSFPASIRSIQIILRANMPNFVSSNWSVLRSLSALPMLTSLYIVLHDMNTGIDESSCRIIAETASMFVDFRICFRRRFGLPTPSTITYSLDDDPALLQILAADPTIVIEYDDEEYDLQFRVATFHECQTSIEGIRRHILRLPLDRKPLIVTEEEGCGMTVWF